MGLDSQNPDFSWRIKSDDYDLNQTHYQLFVATDKTFSKESLFWDSGRVNSSESVYVKYQGKPLEYATKYYWTVKVWTNQSSRPKQSAIGSWTTGLMGKKQWNSDWIGVNNDDKKDPKSPYFTNDFVIRNKITSANLFITSRGIYEAHINGKRVGKSYLTPGWTSYNNRIQYQAYDVKDMLSSGDNRLGVFLQMGGLGISDPIVEREKQIMAMKHHLLQNWLSASKTALKKASSMMSTGIITLDRYKAHRSTMVNL